MNLNIALVTYETKNKAIKGRNAISCILTVPCLYQLDYLTVLVLQIVKSKESEKAQKEKLSKRLWEM